MIGRVIGNYQVTSELARGGMGAVYRGHHLTLPREVVVKSILLAPFSPSAQVHLKARFRREAYIQSQLDHPNIVRVYEFFTGEENYYLVMEYVGGMTLRDLLARQGVPTPAQAVYLFKQALSALDYAHNFSYLDESDNGHTGVIHRDIKPANMLLDTKGKLKLTDFGIAKVIGEQGTGGGMTQTGFQPGTVEYMSPEQIRGGEIDERSDLYSLGVTFYEMLTGQLPFPRSATGSDWEVRKGHMEVEPPPLQEVRATIHPALASIVTRSLAKNPQDRYQSAAEFLEALRIYEQRHGSNGAARSASDRSTQQPLIVATNVDPDLTRPSARRAQAMLEETPTIALETPRPLPVTVSAAVPIFQTHAGPPPSRPLEQAAPPGVSKFRLALAGLGILLVGTVSGAYLFSQGSQSPVPAVQMATPGAASPTPTATVAAMAKSSPKPRPAGSPGGRPGEFSAFRQARQFEQQELYGDAIGVLQQYLTINPTAPDKVAVEARIGELRAVDAALVSADAAMNAGKYELSARGYTAAIRLRPESKRARTGLEQSLSRIPNLQARPRGGGFPRPDGPAGMGGPPRAPRPNLQPDRPPFADPALPPDGRPLNRRRLPTPTPKPEPQP
ncbi:MAG: protein kinase [Blastocatellia bacterium]|nr:protein kinase [Blastocatellia bacterium]